MTLYAIWIGALGLYAAFYAWYVGFRGRVRPEEIERTCAAIRTIDPEREPMVRRMLEQDTGREFYMVNLLRLHRTLASGATGREVLTKYQKPYFVELMRRAGHPIAMAMAATPAVECWGVEHADDWDVAVLVRYRSRRDLAEIISLPMFRTQHPFKVEAVAKTIAFVGDPARILGGGPRLTVPLALLALACALTIALG